ncbi:MAG: hypothetical protein NTW64_01305 [Candidatus Omnitrophica bacterium]|nr:hypothetical protein [Candidatus Omnitrophota bacterium]
MSEEPLYERLQKIDLGNGVAEHDNLLWKCMVETQHFTDLLYDRIDLVLGSKGVGKSSLFRMFGELLEERLLKDWKTVVVSGVETKGDPIFKAYAENFQKFSEAQFETFWRAYLLGLVYNKIFHEERIATIFAPCTVELNNFKKLYDDLGLIDVGRVDSLTKLLKLICAFAIAATEGVKAAWDIEKNQLIFGVNIREKIDKGYTEVSIPDLSKMDTVLCIDALSNLAQKSGYKVWIMLDHLDVVFKRRSPEETRALRALLKILYAFTSDHVRLKIFLRDDILDSISSESDEPLAAVSHITARSGPNLKWTADSLCVMIMKRLASDSWLSTEYGLDVSRLNDVDYARQSFQKIFAFKYVTQHAFDWIFSLITDGRGVVTPRDLIDLLKKALHIQSLWLQKHPGKTEFMTIPAIQEAHRELSKNRKETVLQTEFSHLMHWIRRLERNKERYKKDELPPVFGTDADKAISTLQAIGVIQFDHKKSCYRVAKLYGAGLQVYATREKKNV